MTLGLLAGWSLESGTLSFPLGICRPDSGVRAATPLHEQQREERERRGCPLFPEAASVSSLTLLGSPRGKHGAWRVRAEVGGSVRSRFGGGRRATSSLLYMVNLGRAISEVENGIKIICVNTQELTVSFI